MLDIADRNTLIMELSALEGGLKKRNWADFPFVERDYSDYSIHHLDKRLTMFEALKQLTISATDPRIFPYVYSNKASVVNFIDKFITQTESTGTPEERIEIIKLRTSSQIEFCKVVLKKERYFLAYLKAVLF